MPQDIKITNSAREAALDYGIDISDITPANGEKILLKDVEQYNKDNHEREGGAQDIDNQSNDDDHSNDMNKIESTNPENMEKASSPVVKKGKYICLNAIKEDGVRYKPNDIYKGKNFKYFLEQGIIAKNK